MNRVFAIASVAALLILAVLLHTPIKDFLYIHPWFHSAIVAMPTIALAVFAYFDLQHADEANSLREDANRLRRRIAYLEEERNHHLQQIAENTRKPITQAERNASILRKHLRAKVKVSEGQGGWSDAPEIVEISDDNIVTLFTARGGLTTAAWCVGVRCDELEITEIPAGACPLRIKVLKRYGQDVQLGEITKWEDRNKPTAGSAVPKGANVQNTSYGKPGTGEVRRLNIYATPDGRNSFVLETSTGETHKGDNVEISKRFMLIQIEYEAAGFRVQSSGTGGSPYPLYIKTTG
jgi:hypothetical protein